MGENESLRPELIRIYYRAIQAPVRRWLPIPVHALLDQSTVIHTPGLTMVYGPAAPERGNLLMSHSEVGAGTDQFGNQYQNGDMAYRESFTRATPRGRLGMHIPDTNSGGVQPRADAPHDK